MEEQLPYYEDRQQEAYEDYKNLCEHRDELHRQCLEQSVTIQKANERIKVLEAVIAWANNSLFGSQGFFLSLNGGSDNLHHLDTAIENLKSECREQYIRIKVLEELIKR